MLTPRESAFPFEAVRDLLGILRAMYAAERDGAQNQARLAAIATVALELKQALELAWEHQPGTLGHAAAWHRAEEATRALGHVVDVTTPLEPTLAAAARRIRVSAPPDAARLVAQRARRARG